MNIEALRKKLLAVARTHPPGDHVPFAFERRIMARLAETAPADAWTLWGRALWRAAVSCVAVMVLSGLWSVWPASGNGAAADFSQELETAVFVMADHVDDSW
jgi:hypothetical protein